MIHPFIILGLGRILELYKENRSQILIDLTTLELKVSKQQRTL